MKKTFDWVPREVVKWTMRKLGVGECYIRPIMTMYRNGNSVIRGDRFGVTVGVHQGSALSRLLLLLKLFQENIKAAFLWK